MLDWMGEPLAVALVGLAGGIVLGLAARLGRFCTLGAIEDCLYGGDTARLRMWGVAIGVAIVGTHAAIGTGLLVPQQTTYLAQSWYPAASVFGGVAFGYGMALAGNCGFGALARLGGGDLRAFLIVLVMGLAAYATLSGPFAALRVALFPPIPTGVELSSLSHGTAAAAGLSPVLTGTFTGLAIAALSAARARFLDDPRPILWGIAVGLAIVSGWVGTAWVGQAGFAPVPVQSHTFAAPLGETMLWIMTASGGGLGFGVGSVTGVLAGAFMGSLLKGQVRWEACEDPRELRRQIVGAALMGMGAVLAVGCTIGQGLTAFSLLAWSAPVTFAAVFAGCALGLRQLITGILPNV